MKPTAKIISYNLHGEKVCASAAKISTTSGTALELFEASNDVEKNRKLIKKVLSSGHVSLIEHAVFTIAFTNVSAFVEQFFIECRLASFTVKSRRYVDFSHAGYYIPQDMSDSDLEFYSKYMNMLFEAYETLLELEIPKEDARFLLPYSFNSNFYCTVNARELSQIISSIENGRGQEIQELKDLAEQIKEQVIAIKPCLLMAIDKPIKKDLSHGKKNFFEYGLSFVDHRNAGGISIFNAPTQPKLLLDTALQISHPLWTQYNIGSLLTSSRARELEQLSYTFYVSDISLSGITHIVRHRMQSIIIPPLGELIGYRQILPESIQNNTAALAVYHESVLEAYKMRMSIYNSMRLTNYHFYFLLSGCLTNIITTMNARELSHFVQLRSCNRAQWEIRNISIRMLGLARDNFPELFELIGPSCFVKGNCPEGKMTCGKEKEVKRFFGNRITVNG